MCCSSSSCSAKGLASTLLRITFGLSLLFMGIIHYRDLANFSALVTAGLPPALMVPGLIWSYILPGLFVLGGLLMVLGVWMRVGTALVGIGLSSIPVGMLLKSVLGGLDLTQTMPATVNAWVWFIIFVLAVKGCDSKFAAMMCGGGACGSSCDCDSVNCADCGKEMCGKCEEVDCVCDEEKPMGASAPAKSAMKKKASGKKA